MLTVITTFQNSIDENEQLVTDAIHWSSTSLPIGTPAFTSRHKEILTELAFFRAFLAWELFLEESFILYLLGQRAPRGTPPIRFVTPTTREIAMRVLNSEGVEYIKWTSAEKIITRSQNFFQSGDPYASALTGNTSFLSKMNTLRNAIAHSQSSALEKFKRLVRNEPGIGTYPPGLTVGGFLSGRKPSTRPPQTFFEDYMARLRIIAGKIVPS